MKKNKPCEKWMVEEGCRHPHGVEQAESSNAAEWNLPPEDRREKIADMVRFVSEVPPHSLSLRRI